MKIEIVSEQKIFEDVSLAIAELAFCHYPVRVRIDNETKSFDSFDAARAFVIEDKR